ncbi:MAG: carbohydrate ABC transporter permease [Saccharofermentanales bacterium]
MKSKMAMKKGNMKYRLRFLRTKKRLNRSKGVNFALFLMLFGIGSFMILPLLYAVVNAFKPLEEFFIFPPRFYVSNPTTNNFADLYKLTANLWVPFTRYVFNSVYISVIATVGHIFLASTAAYVMAKHRFPGQKILNSVIILSLLFTSRVIFIPQYIILSKLGFINTHIAVIAPIFAMSIGIFLMKQFMTMVPDEVIESAKIDGAGEMRTCWRVVVPMVKPATVTLAIFAFQAVWNSSGAGVIYTESLKVMPMVLSQIASGGLARAGVGAAASLIMLIPPVTLFVFFQSKIIETMSASGIKG